jgi:ferric-dicitrate binding protein FerR (iron transport regulator)
MGKRSSLGVDDMVFLKQTIRTDRGGYVKLLYEDGSAIELEEDTVSTIESDETRAAKKTRLDEGQLTARIVPQAKGREMLFTTPHATAEAIGTGLALRILEGGTRLDVKDGLVRFSDLEERSVEVPSGHYAVAERGSGPVAVMDSVDYDRFSLLRRLHRDAEVVRKDDFEAGMGMWSPFEATAYPQSRRAPRSRRKG